MQRYALFASEPKTKIIKAGEIPALLVLYCAAPPRRAYFAGPAYRSMMVPMPSWHTGQKASLRSNIRHCMAGR
ncbi:hypothetical protein SAMN02982985_00205 [Rugamonas rubra]|uniref:Uncharacterized protein n=1 Tax=Rugamonas rubra TaxID=758825 RepID=A0A1I4HUL1_9BURK|nr:hypothetical protein SAMN02982985_00205 [Rugamonas rubra]